MSSTPKGCAACGGSPEEHGPGKTAHVYTELEGQLMSHEEKAKMDRRGQQQPQLVQLPQRIQGTDAGAITRLLELMLEKNLLTQLEALYIMGVGTKPPKAEGYKDPMQLAFGVVDGK